VASYNVEVLFAWCSIVFGFPTVAVVMKMDSLSKSSTASSSNRSSGTGRRSSNLGGGNYRDSAHFAANIMVEFENDTREMAVDVPDSFIAHAKTPPKYPPPQPRANGTLPGSNSGSGRSLGRNTLNSSNRDSPDAPPLASRDHLRIERDGVLLNSRDGPTPPRAGSVGNGGSGYVRPTEQQSLRMKKYSEEIIRKNLEQERRDRGEEFLRHSIRNSQRLAALKHRMGASSGLGSATMNGGFSPEGVGGVGGGIVRSSAASRPEPLPNLEEILAAAKRLEARGVLHGVADSVLAAVGATEVENVLTLNQKVRGSLFWQTLRMLWNVKPGTWTNHPFLLAASGAESLAMRARRNRRAVRTGRQVSGRGGDLVRGRRN